MILEPQITFRDVAPSPALTRYVLSRVEKLDGLHARVTSCRVVVEAPHRHHHIGSHYRVRVDLTLHGGELLAGSRASDDPTREDAYAAVDDAFDEAERAVREFVRRQRGDTKSPHRPMRGRVTKLFPLEGYGFIETAEGGEVYFHRNSVLKGAFERLGVGQRVRLEVEDGDRGPQASSVAMTTRRPPPAL